MKAQLCPRTTGRDTQDTVLSSSPAGARALHPKALEAGRASWEEARLPICERVRKHWREMLVHLWGPTGSVVFHVLALGALVVFVVRPDPPVIEGPLIDMQLNADANDLDRHPELDRRDKPLPEKPDPTTGNSDSRAETSTEAPGSSDLQQAGIGPGGDDPAAPVRGIEVDTPSFRGRLTLPGLVPHRAPGARGVLVSKYSPGMAGPIEDAVLRGLRWLKKNQQADGSWEKVKPAMTGLALLAFLAHDETPSSSKEFGDTVRRGIDFLIGNQQLDGRFKDKDGNNYALPIGTYALCEAYAMTQHPSVKDAAVRGIALICHGQNAFGGFNYDLETTSGRCDSSYMAWCCQALKAAKMAGLESDVPELARTIKLSIAGLKHNAHPNGGFGYDGPGQHGLSGADAVCMQLLGAPHAPEVKGALAFLAPATFSFENYKQQPYGEEFPLYHWYYITQTKFHDSDETFKAWNRQFAPELCKTQIIETKGIEDARGRLVDIGHWVSPSDAEQKRLGGVVEDTALCTLMLEVYYRYLPSFQHAETVPQDMASEVGNKDIAVKIR